MLIPRYFFTNDFQNFYEYFLTKPHKKKDLDKGSYLWKPNTLMEKIHYIVSGTAQNYVEHEKGHKKIISFHGRGTVFPGYHGFYLRRFGGVPAWDLNLYVRKEKPDV